MAGGIITTRKVRRALTRAICIVVMAACGYAVTTAICAFAFFKLGFDLRPAALGAWIGIAVLALADGVE